MRPLLTCASIIGAALFISLTASCAPEVPARAATTAAQASATPTDPGEVHFETFRETTYDSFIMNTYPDFFLAAIRSGQDWDAIFQPAGMMDPPQPFAPDLTLYVDKMILLITHTAPHIADENTFIIDSVSQEHGHMTIRYRYTKPTSSSTAFFWCYIGIIIPRAAYTDATFIENGKNVGTIPINVR